MLVNHRHVNIVLLNSILPFLQAFRLSIKRGLRQHFHIHTEINISSLKIRQVSAKYLKILYICGETSESSSVYYTNIAWKSPMHTSSSTSANRSQQQGSELQKSGGFLSQFNSSSSLVYINSSCEQCMVKYCASKYLALLFSKFLVKKYLLLTAFPVKSIDIFPRNFWTLSH